MEDRKEKLKLVMKDLNKKFKDPTLLKMGGTAKETLPTGIKEIDDFSGGWTIGNFSVVYGTESVGKSTIALQSIAYAQSQGKICCLIDLENSFDLLRASELGVNLEELILIDTAENAEQAMDIMIALAREKVVDFIVVDSIQAMSPKGEQETKKGKEKSINDETIALLARQLGHFFRVCSTPIFKGKVAVLMIGQVRTQGIGSFYTHDGLSGGKALLHWSYQTIYMRRGQNADAPQQAWKELFLDPDGKMHKVTKKDSVGFDCVLKLEKTKSSKSETEGSNIHVPFYFETGFQKPEEKEEIIKIAGTEEEKKRIQELLDEKAGKKNPFKLLHADTVIIDDVQPSSQKKEGKGEEKNGKKSEASPKGVKKKRGRGRPKKGSK